MVRLVPAYRDRMVGKTGRTINSLPTIQAYLLSHGVSLCHEGGWLVGLVADVLVGEYLNCL